MTQEFRAGHPDRDLMVTPTSLSVETGPLRESS